MLEDAPQRTKSKSAFKRFFRVCKGFCRLLPARKVSGRTPSASSAVLPIRREYFLEHWLFEGLRGQRNTAWDETVTYLVGLELPIVYLHLVVALKGFRMLAKKLFYHVPI